MLVLTRHEGEEIVFLLPDGGTITVKALEGRSGKLRLGITAPAEVRVFRLEVLARIQREREEVSKL